MLKRKRRDILNHISILYASTSFIKCIREGIKWILELSLCLERVTKTNWSCYKTLLRTHDEDKGTKTRKGLECEQSTI